MNRNTQNRTIPALFLAVCALMFSAACACGDPVVAVQDWNTAGVQGWTNYYGVVSLDNPGAGGNTGGWLRVTFASNGAPAAAYDVVRVSASNLFAGAWTTNMWVDFDFWASNAAPDHLKIWWGSSSNVWMSGDLAFSGTGAWSNVIGPKFNYGNWTPDTFGLNEAAFLADLAAINWIGVYIWRGGIDEQIYGIDNFRLMIPEPGELIMLAVAMAMTVMATRKKRRKGAPGANSS